MAPGQYIIIRLAERNICDISDIHSSVCTLTDSRQARRWGKTGGKTRAPRRAPRSISSSTDPRTSPQRIDDSRHAQRHLMLVGSVEGVPAR